MHPTQHSTIPPRKRGMTNDEGRMTNEPPRDVGGLLVEAVTGLQLLALRKAQRETHALNIEPPHAALLRKAAQQSAPFRVRSTSTGEAA